MSETSWTHWGVLRNAALLEIIFKNRERGFFLSIFKHDMFSLAVLRLFPDVQYRVKGWRCQPLTRCKMSLLFKKAMAGSS
jgi:hypothetical protein